MNRLFDYVLLQKQKGVLNSSISESLKKAGWNELDIEAALSGDIVPTPDYATFNSDITATQPLAYNYTLWDTFQHFLMFLTMAIYATALDMLTYQLLERLLPSKEAPWYEFYSYSFGQYFGMALMSVVIITFPIFVFLFIKIKRQTLANPALKSLKSRKVLTYITLGVTFLIVLGNIVSMLFQVLTGNLALTNFLHFLSPIFMCSIIFTYFIREAREK